MLRMEGRGEGRGEGAKLKKNKHTSQTDWLFQDCLDAKEVHNFHCF